MFGPRRTFNVDVDLPGSNAAWTCKQISTSSEELPTSIFSPEVGSSMNLRRVEIFLNPHCVTDQETNTGIYTAVRTTNLHGI
jgi:hypothetical protein